MAYKVPLRVECSISGREDMFLDKHTRWNYWLVLIRDDMG